MLWQVERGVRQCLLSLKAFSKLEDATLFGLKNKNKTHIGTFSFPQQVFFSLPPTHCHSFWAEPTLCIPIGILSQKAVLEIEIFPEGGELRAAVASVKRHWATPQWRASHIMYKAWPLSSVKQDVGWGKITQIQRKWQTAKACSSS